MTTISSPPRISLSMLTPDSNVCREALGRDRSMKSAAAAYARGFVTLRSPMEPASISTTSRSTSFPASRFGHQSDSDCDRGKSGDEPRRLRRDVLSRLAHRARRVSLLNVRSRIDLLQRALHLRRFQNLADRPDREWRNQPRDELESG